MLQVVCHDAEKAPQRVHVLAREPLKCTTLQSVDITFTGTQHSCPTARQRDAQDASVVGIRATLDQTVRLQRQDERVHCLRRHQGGARQLGRRQTRAAFQDAERRVLRC